MTADEREFGWDDEIGNDDQGEFAVAEAGDYDFEIVDLQRKRHQAKPGGKLPDCPKAELTVRVHTADGVQVDIKRDLFLHSRCEGFLCAFFRSIGQRKHGERLRPDWSRVIGSRGRCKVAIRTWKNSEGQDRKGNDVKAFLDPPKTGTQPPADSGGF
jgi:hypothetical protein